MSLMGTSSILDGYPKKSFSSVYVLLFFGHPSRIDDVPIKLTQQHDFFIVHLEHTLSGSAGRNFLQFYFNTKYSYLYAGMHKGPAKILKFPNEIIAWGHIVNSKLLTLVRGY